MLLTRYALLFSLLGPIGAAEAGPSEKSIVQLRKYSGMNLEANASMDTLLKIGAVSGFGMILGSTYTSGGILAVEAELRACYSRAASANTNVVNFLICYVSDKTIYDLFKRQADGRGGLYTTIAEDYEKGLRSRLDFAMDQLSVATNVRKSFRADFDAAQHQAQGWIETLTLGELSACVKNGVGAASCP